MLVLGLPIVTALFAAYLADREKVAAADRAAHELVLEERLAEGFDLLGWDGYEEALRVFEAVLGTDTDSAEAVAGVAMAQLSLQRAEDALRTLDLHAEAIGRRRVGGLLRIDALRRLGREEEAQRVAAALPEATDSIDHYLVGSRLVGEGDAGRKEAYAEAIEPLTTAIFSGGARALYFRRLVSATGHARDFARLRTAVAAMRSRWPDSARCHLNIGFGLMAGGLIEEAIAALRTCVRLEPEYPNARALLGSALYRQGLHGDREILEEALREVRAALALGTPIQAHCHNVIGLIFDAMGRYEEAEAAFRESLRLESNVAIVHYNLARTLGQRGRPEESMEECWKALEVAPQHDGVLNLFGIALANVGRPDEALQKYEVALQANSQNADAMSNLGLALLQRDPRDERALRLCAGAVRLFPADKRYQLNLGSALLVRDDLAGFERYLRELPEIAGSTPGHARQRAEFAKLHYELGDYLRRKGRFEDALPRYAKAIDLAPEYAEAWCDRGYVLGLLGRHEESLASLRRGDELGRRSPEWRFKSQDWVARAEGLTELERRVLGAIAADDFANMPGELDQIRLILRARGLHRADARVLEARIAEAPERHEDPWMGLRTAAARAAVLTGTGRGEDAAASSAEERTAWRSKARAWLAADFAWVRTQRAAIDTAAAKAKLEEWLAEPDFAGVREEQALVALPVAERRAWRELWSELRDLLAELNA